MSFTLRFNSEENIINNQSIMLITINYYCKKSFNNLINSTLTMIYIILEKHVVNKKEVVEVLKLSFKKT